MVLWTVSCHEAKGDTVWLKTKTQVHKSRFNPLLQHDFANLPSFTLLQIFSACKGRLPLGDLLHKAFCLIGRKGLSVFYYNSWLFPLKGSAVLFIGQACHAKHVTVEMWAYLGLKLKYWADLSGVLRTFEWET